MLHHHCHDFYAKILNGRYEVNEGSDTTKAEENPDLIMIYQDDSPYLFTALME